MSDFQTMEKGFLDTLAAIEDGLDKIVIVGGWCPYLYAKYLWRKEIPNIPTTTDIFGDLQEAATLVFLLVEEEYVAINRHFFGGDGFAGHPRCGVIVHVFFSWSHVIPQCEGSIPSSLSLLRGCKLIAGTLRATGKMDFLSANRALDTTCVNRDTLRHVTVY